MVLRMRVSLEEPICSETLERENTASDLRLSTSPDLSEHIVSSVRCLGLRS